MKQIIEAIKENFKEDPIGTLADFAFIIVMCGLFYYFIWS